MSDYIDELVAKHFPCAGTGCRKYEHDAYCPASQRRKGTDLARAVAERVKASARVCLCAEPLYRGGHTMEVVADPDCPHCRGRGVTFGGEA